MAQSHTPNDHCVRFAVVVTFHDATLVTGQALPLSRTGLSPAGPRQLRLAHRYSFIVSDLHQLLLADLSGALRKILDTTKRGRVHFRIPEQSWVMPTSRFRSQKAHVPDLAPRFLLRGDQQFVALRLQFRRGFFDIPYVKLDPTLWHGKIAGPLIRAKTGLCRLRQRPQGKMRHAIKPVSVEVAIGLSSLNESPSASE